MGTKLVYEPKNEADYPYRFGDHRCILPDKWQFDLDTIIRCDCGQYYYLNIPFLDYGRRWRLVRWWNWGVKSRIHRWSSDDV